MSHRNRTTVAKWVLVAGSVLVATGFDQSVESKLSQKAALIPQHKSALEQLIEVAQHYKFLMGIEWTNQPGADDALPAHASPTTVQGLISAILQQSPDYQAKITNGVLHVAQPMLAADAKNFLNLRIPEFQVARENLFGASFTLRLKIKMTLHLELYASGWNGGYGYAPGHVFGIPNIMSSGKNLTVREILNRIAAANGNALWVVRLIPSKMMANEPFLAQATLEGNEAPVADFHWQFVPLEKMKPDQE